MGRRGLGEPGQQHQHIYPAEGETDKLVGGCCATPGAQLGALR